MSARFDKRNIVIEYDQLGITILAGGKHLGVIDATFMSYEEFKARNILASMGKFYGVSQNKSNPKKQ